MMLVSPLNTFWTKDKRVCISLAHFILVHENLMPLDGECSGCYLKELDQY